jgi:hypothetical protein
MYGLELLVPNKDGMIRRVLTFRQLTSHEQEQYVKPDFRR